MNHMGLRKINNPAKEDHKLFVVKKERIKKGKKTPKISSRETPLPDEARKAAIGAWA